MLGKILGAIIILGAVFFAATWFFTGLGPMDIVKAVTGPSKTDVTSENSNSFAYNYVISVGEPINKKTSFAVDFHVVKKTSNTICYTYKVTSVTEGSASDAYNFMEQAYGAKEGTPTCTPLSTEDKSHKPWFPLVSSSTTVAAKKAENGYKYSYKYVFGVLRSFHMETTYRSASGTAAPATIDMKFVGAQSSAKPTSKTTSTTSKGKSEPSSLDVHEITYRFQWEIHQIDIVTGKPAGTVNLDYTVNVSVVRRTADTACIKYSIVDIKQGDLAQAKQLTEEALGYPENKEVCTNIAAEPTPDQIPYFLFNPKLTKSDIKFNGNEAKGVLAVKNGILYSLVLNTKNTITDENGNEVASAPVKLIVTLIKLN
ncbi:hypothetical protein PYJP_19220 [Pyrofollis japonicus]|uniref:hypothetical protein n=1 Tax=Pyrofollis japonicus TaxID=3060460 RepID=UPI00295AA235|nr:hypothetical protein [Pyrofollis japonicus]BEP18570.1 hypothetical protein PYJP_19220 [Pyrofollis japonicus]